MLDTVDHLIRNVLPAADDYNAAERALLVAVAADPTPAAWEAAGWDAKRQAGNLAIAIDGLTDRCAIDLGRSGRGALVAIRSEVAKLCVWPGTNLERAGCIERIRGVANAYKHANLKDRTLPIASDKDVLAVATPYGIDAWGVGKYGGMTVLVRESDGKLRKFLADAPTAVAAWMRFLSGHGAMFPAGPYIVCGLQVYP
jgi:hypothetical protein